MTRSRVGSSDADVVESAVVSQGDGAGLVDAVVSDPVMGFGVCGRAWHCLGHRVVEGFARASHGLMIIRDERAKLDAS